MNLQEYQQNLKNALLKNAYDKVKIDKQVIKGGGSFINEKPLFDTGILGPSAYGENVHEFKHLYNAMIRPRAQEVFKAPILTGKKKPKSTIPIKHNIESEDDTNSDNSSDDNDDRDQMVQGGSMNFVKSLKGIGKSAGKVVLSESLKPVGRAVGDSIVQAGKSLFTPANLAAVGETALEEAPMIAMAAGMKKKTNRRVSEKTRRRHELIKKLMKQHNVSLAEANSHISKHKLKY